jgi:hypothetical protein
MLFLPIHNVWGVNGKPPYDAFDLEAFKGHVRAIHDLDPKQVPPERKMQREDGLRFLIELRHSSNANHVIRILEKEFRFKYPIETKPLFPESAEDKRFVEFKLDRYYQLRFMKYAYEDLKFNVFDLAYFLRKLTGENKIEPDIPFGGFYPMGGSQFCDTHENQTSDMAWPLRNVAPSTSGTTGGMNIVAAWEYARSLNPPKPDQGQGIRIAHPDTGYNDHEDFKTNQENIDLGSGYDTVDDDPVPIDPLNYNWWLTFAGHGISTGSVMVSAGDVDSQPQSGLNGGTGPPGIVTGVAPQATLIPIRCMRSPVRLFFGSVVQAVDHAVALQPPDECHVISMSLGGLPSPSLKTAIDIAVSQNIIVLAAAGNYTWWVVSPAAFPACIAVAASNVRDEIWPGSAAGAEVDFAAPGESVWRARRDDLHDPQNDVKRGCGTSLSTAGVAGVAALWLAYHGRQNLIQQLSGGRKLQDLFRTQVKKTVRVPSGWDTNSHGEGIVDARRLLEEPISQPVTAQIDFHHWRFNYLDIIIRMFGNKNRRIISELLSETFKTNQSELEATMEVWGAELSYLFYSNPQLNELFFAMVADTHTPVQKEASVLAYVIKKYSSRTLAQFINQQNNQTGWKK